MGKRKSITGIKRRPKTQTAAAPTPVRRALPDGLSLSPSPTKVTSARTSVQVPKLVRKKRKSIAGIKRRRNAQNKKSATVEGRDLHAAAVRSSSLVVDNARSSLLPKDAARKRRKSITGVKKGSKSNHVLSTIITPSPSPTSFEAVDTETAGDPTPTPTQNRRKRARSETDHAKDEEPRKRFASLKPRTTYVKPKVINEKWQPLPATIRHKLFALLKLAERPIISRFSADEEGALSKKQFERLEEKRKEIQSTLEIVGDRLRNGLIKAKFPPNAKAMNFDHEVILRSNRSFEQQLDPTLHAIALLEVEIKKEERALSKEKAELAKLKKNAKNAEAERRRIEAQMPSFTRSEIETDDGPGKIGLVTRSSNRQALSELYSDSSAQPLVTQLQSHLDSMELNASSVTGISESLLKARSVLNELLHLKKKS